MHFSEAWTQSHLCSRHSSKTGLLYIPNTCTVGNWDWSHRTLNIRQCVQDITIIVSMFCYVVLKAESELLVICILSQRKQGRNLEVPVTLYRYQCNDACYSRADDYYSLRAVGKRELTSWPQIDPRFKFSFRFTTSQCFEVHTGVLEWTHIHIIHSDLNAAVQILAVYTWIQTIWYTLDLIMYA